MFGRFAFARLLAAATICFALAASAPPTSLSRPHAQGCHQGLRRIAQAAYGDSLDMARALKLAVDAFLQSSCRARDVDRGPHPLRADRGFPLRQSAERSQT